MIESPDAVADRCQRIGNGGRTCLWRSARPAEWCDGCTEVWRTAVAELHAMKRSEQ